MSTLKTYTVEIFGHPFNLVSDESNERVAEIASQVDTLMREVSHESGISDLKKVSVLTAVKLVYQLNESEKCRAHIESACQQLIKLVDTVL